MANKLLKVTSQYTVRIAQKEHLLMIWNSETTQNLNIYCYNYQTETAIFLVTKHEKNSYGMQLFIYFLNISFILNFWPANESIHLNSWHHSHKKQKDSLETQVLFVDILP